MQNRQSASDAAIDAAIARSAEKLHVDNQRLPSTPSAETSEADEGEFLEDPNGHKTASDVEFVTEEELIERDKDIIK